MRGRARFSYSSQLDIATTTDRENIRCVLGLTMAPPRTQCLNTARCFIQRPLEIRASFSTSAIVRAGTCLLKPEPKTYLSPCDTDGPSHTTAADGLLASLGERDPSKSKSSPAGQYAQPVRQPVRPDAHTPTRTSNQRIGNLVSASLARRARQAQSGRKPGQPSLNTMQELENAKKASDLSRQITRRWRAGDVYAPHDLSAQEMDKWRKRSEPKHDIFDLLDFKPLENYKVRHSSAMPLALSMATRHCDQWFLIANI